jgi:hypothetical protein
MGEAMSAQPESKLSRAIMAALRNRGIYCFKVHGGPMTQAGTPDIVACVPVTVQSEFQGTPVWSDPIGIFVGFETKMPDGGNPTPVQVHQHNKIRAACGHVFVPRSVQDAVAAIEGLGWVDPGPSGVRAAMGL